MKVLGSFGNLYMAVLLILLSAGLLFAVYEMVKRIVGYISEIQTQKGTTISSKFGGMTIMKSNGWLKLAVFSFVGLIISVVLLNLTNPTAAFSTEDQHRLHVNGTANATGTVGNMMNGTVNGTVNMDQMNEVMQRMNQLQQDMMMLQQQYMNGMQSQSNTNMGTSGGMSSSGGMMDDDMDMNMNGSGGSGSSSGGGMGMM